MSNRQANHPQSAVILSGAGSFAKASAESKDPYPDGSLTKSQGILTIRSAAGKNSLVRSTNCRLSFDCATTSFREFVAPLEDERKNWKSASRELRLGLGTGN